MPLNRIHVYQFTIHKPVKLLLATCEFLPGFTGRLLGLPRKNMELLRIFEFLAVNMGKNRVKRPQSSGFFFVTKLVIQSLDIHGKILDKHFVHHEMGIHARSHNQLRGDRAYRDILCHVSIRLAPEIRFAGKLRCKSTVSRQRTNLCRNDLFALKRLFEYIERERFGSTCHGRAIQQSTHIVFIGKIHAEKTAPGHLLPSNDGLDVKSDFDVHTLKKGGRRKPPALTAKLLLHECTVSQFAGALECNT